MRNLVLFLILAMTPACVVVPEAVENNVTGEVAIHDGYARKINEALNGESEDPAANVTQADLANTPPSVLLLLQRTIKSIYLSRASWKALAHAMDLGEDPATIEDKHPEPTVTAGQ